MIPVIPKCETRPPIVINLDNVFMPDKDRRFAVLDRQMTIREYLDGEGIVEFDRPTICLHNGVAVLRQDWATLEIKQGDVCTFVALPHGGGGGGGGGGSNPLQIVMMIVVVVLSVYTGGAVGAAYGAMWGKIAAGVVMVAGSALVNALVPFKPNSPSISFNGNTASAERSPTYSLSAQGNAARVGEPISVIYGRHRIYPDLAATPYQEYVDNEQYLFQLHCIGLGEHDVEIIRIEDTPISNFSEVTTEVVQPGGSVTIFDPNVISAAEVTGQELFGTNEDEHDYVGPFVCNPADTTANYIGIDVVMPQGLYYSNDSGGLDDRTVTWAIEAREIDEAGDPVGAGDWIVLGANFTATDISVDSSDKSFNSTTTDFVDEGISVGTEFTTSGFANADNNATHTVTSVTSNKVIVSTTLTTEAAGASAIFEPVGEKITDNEPSTKRISYKYPVTTGRYEVRAKRTNDSDTSSRAGDSIQWVQLRGYLNISPDFSNVTLLAVKMRATNNLSQQTSRLINCIVTRKLPIWDEVTETWSAPIATRSIVWAFCDAAMSDYGAGLDESRLRMSQLVAIDELLEARGDHFDGVFDSQTTVWDALQKVARCGRALPIMQGGAVRIVRDSEQTIPVAMFGPRNIVKGSLSIEYVMPGEDTADSVEVEYFSAKTWNMAYVTAAVAGSDEEKTAKVRIFGITDADHAQREADYMAHDNRYRRKFVNFRTELEGMIPTYGDLITVTHDMPRWGQGGELVAWTADDVGAGAPYENAVLTLSEVPEFVEGDNHYIALRKTNGELVGPFACVVVEGQANQVQLTEDLTMTPYVGTSMERTYYTFGPTDKWTQYCRVLSIKPRNGGEQVEISAVAEDNRVHVN